MDYREETKSVLVMLQEADACFGGLGNLFVELISKVLMMSNCCLSREFASSHIWNCTNDSIMFVGTGSKQSLFLSQLWSQLSRANIISMHGSIFMCIFIRFDL